jgi:hypothetical protein
MAECFFPKAIIQSSEKHVSFTPPIEVGRQYVVARQTKPVKSVLLAGVSAVTHQVLKVCIAEFGLMFD